MITQPKLSGKPGQAPVRVEGVVFGGRGVWWEWGCGVVGRGRADEIRASVFTNDVTPAVRRISAQ